MTDRRLHLKGLATLGIGNAVFQRSLCSQVAEHDRTTISPEMITQAEWISGISLTESDREVLTEPMNHLQTQLQSIRAVTIEHDVAPAVQFTPLQHRQLRTEFRRRVELPSAKVKRPTSDDDLAFLTVSELGVLLRNKQVTTLELTQLYLARLRKYGPTLKCVVTLTEERALQQARRADTELAAGKVRGPVHGIPWGAKDLIAYPGYPTTWGAPQFKERELPDKATVAQRLDDAGAVLVAKLSLGALAMGDQWYGGMTRNPWDTEQGSSGSSAGSASATVAGLVGFALGSETLGSIVSPCRRCGATGLRPTFGRVSRHGCMPLSWSMDKIGPITRSVEDAALVFGAIHGADGRDLTAIDMSFLWPETLPLADIRVGFFEDDETSVAAVKVLRALGATLKPVQLPKAYPIWESMIILTAEAATSFHDFTHQGITKGLNTWPNEFRKGHHISAVDYLRANRIRTQLMRAMNDVFQDVDLYVGGPNRELGITNLSGHPSVVLPNGFEDIEGKTHPTALTFTGGLYRESILLKVAHAYQKATHHHLKHPALQ